MLPEFTWIVLGVGSLIPLVAVGLYAWGLYNELSSIRERLHGLLGTARLMKARRHAAGRAVGRHVGRAARHVENTTRHACAGEEWRPAHEDQHGRFSRAAARGPVAAGHGNRRRFLRPGDLRPR